jgi:hypothetical protein
MNAEQPRMTLRRVCRRAATEAVTAKKVGVGQGSDEAELDAALAMTFPASDPVAIHFHAAVARLPPQ